MVKFDYKLDNSDHTMSVKKRGEKITMLIVYLDIVITGNDTCEITNVKRRLASEFERKTSKKLQYYFGFEVSRSPGEASFHNESIRWTF